MPELPEVETIRCGLQRCLPGLRIKNITIQRPSLIKGSPQLFRARVRQAKIGEVIRRGKLLAVSLIPAHGKQPFFLTVHLRMSGCLMYTHSVPDTARIIFELDNENFLIYTDQRCLGELRVVSDWQSLPFIRAMGPEPLDAAFDANKFSRILAGRAIPIKTLLLDQRKIAGIGNIYACEALFSAGINPRRRADTLTAAEAEVLLREIKSVMRAAIQCRGTTFSNYRDGRGKRGAFVSRLRVYGRAEEPCVLCQTLIERCRVGGRGTYFCPQCQR